VHAFEVEADCFGGAGGSFFVGAGGYENGGGGAGTWFRVVSILV